MNRIFKKWWIFLLVLPVLVSGGFVVWAETPLGPMPEAQSALTSGAQVAVQTSPWMVFRPLGKPPTTGLILYPGGRVDPKSYAPAARAIASQGFLVVIVPMPLNLAVLNSSAAEKVISAFPEIQEWAIGGHSLGGAMAAHFAHDHPTQVKGLVLWAAYPAASDDLSSQDIRVTSIYGPRDGLATGGKITASRALLPPDTTWVAIEGGNHAQFGWYGSQPGDQAATISRSDQQQQIVNATVTLLLTIEALPD